jgi:outer membrane protein
MKKVLVSGVLGALMVAAGLAQAADDWLIRARVINVAPDVSSSLAGLDANDQTTAELDFTYFLNKNVGVELILATTRHEVTLNGASLGKVSVLPPTLTLQYHFNPDSTFKPYVGAGVNYTRFYSVSLDKVLPLDVDRNSWGGALQAGIDIALDKKSYLNFDVKKIYIKTDVRNSATGAHVSDLKIDPVVWGIGYGRRF